MTEKKYADQLDKDIGLLHIDIHVACFGMSFFV